MKPYLTSAEVHPYRLPRAVAATRRADLLDDRPQPATAVSGRGAQGPSFLTDVQARGGRPFNPHTLRSLTTEFQ